MILLIKIIVMSYNVVSIHFEAFFFQNQYTISPLPYFGVNHVFS